MRKKPDSNEVRELRCAIYTRKLLARLRKNTEGAVWEVPKDVPPDYLDMLPYL